ncbi:AbrB family transcriptional regulator [Roseovarius spongiae]|uniref:AbrB family transcriptional regulator n=1 Tax=Roseovarius spongiae TaxID=2320272 RepID=A0A3A8AZM4_9RHOB|nr:AbrB family transcriptional regulator [Roseovarius spongiae]RKF17079.1 AbrB family transcriptional regulator [Roseovarius spongiae]
MARLATTTLLILGAALCGHAASALGAPLPYMLGPLALTALVATLIPHRLPEGYLFPPALRLTFIAVIGLMIGAQVTPALFDNAGRLGVSAAALALFVVVAMAVNYAIFRRLGGYDPATAFYAGAPGGLYESIAMGEATDADLPRLMLQQFMRIILVVTALPVGLSLWLGGPVGSSAGLSFAGGAVPWQALPWLVIAGAAGLALGRALRLPAGQITGPMAVAAALSLSGLGHLDVPQWLVNAAQVVIGAALGMRFTGIGPAMILRGAGLSVLSVSTMLLLAAGIATLLRPALGEHFDVLLISFAPGGVTEMALIALSLEANPAFVTLHHILRILITVLGIGLSGRVLKRRL